MSRDQESLIEIASSLKRILRYTVNVNRDALEVNDEKLSAIIY
jgi:uncharacterized protein with HEPN domain